MYGLAGHQYTPGQPNLSTLGAKERRSKPKAVAGQPQRKSKTGKHGYESKTKKGGLKYGEAW